MRLLIDTHVVLWWLADDRKLSDTARGYLRDRANEVLVSAASAWEVAIKQALGKLTVAGDFTAAVDSAGFVELSLRFEHAAETRRLPPIHRDPFDRMLVAQARVENVPLLTADRRLQSYPANILLC